MAYRKRGADLDSRTAEILKKIGERIKAARLQRKMSQADLAAQAGLDLSHISDIERGRTSMRLPTFIKIIEALEISADTVLRPDIPEVYTLYQGEFADVLKGCTPNEIDSILKIVKELKSTMHQNQSERN
jgi:transcriptional regulator with XRE-family HTH domain